MGKKEEVHDGQNHDEGGEYGKEHKDKYEETNEYEVEHEDEDEFDHGYDEQKGEKDDGEYGNGDEYEDELEYDDDDDNHQVGLPERNEGWLRLLFLSPSSIASDA